MMVFTFDKNYSGYYFIKRHDAISYAPRGATGYASLENYIRNRKILIGMIKKKFESVKFDDTHLSFTFDDIEDEAFFLVWSSGGIEL